MLDDNLDKLKSRILYTLWRRRRNRDGGLITAQTILAELPDEKAVPHKPEKALKKLRKALRLLEKAGYVESGTVAKEEESQPGPPPNGYRLPEEAKSITWQCTSAIILKLFHHPYEPVVEEAFVSEVLEGGLRRDDTGLPLTKDDIVNQVAYCVRKGYITVTDGHDDASGQIGLRHLHRTLRIDKEKHLIEMIAGSTEKKRVGTATERDSASTALGQAVSGGGVPQS